MLLAWTSMCLIRSVIRLLLRTLARGVWSGARQLDIAEVVLAYETVDLMNFI